MVAVYKDPWDAKGVSTCSSASIPASLCCLLQSTTTDLSHSFEYSFLPMASPANGPAQKPMVDQNDIHDWVGRFNGALADTKTITGEAPMDARPWSESFFGCFAPIDTCTSLPPSTQRTLANFTDRSHHLLCPMRHLWQNPPSCAQTGPNA